MPARFTSLMPGHYPATAVTARPGLAALAGAALDELAEAVGAEVGALWGAREESGPLVLLAARGLGPGAVPDTVTTGEGLGGRAVAESRAVTATHATMPPPYMKRCGRLQKVSRASVRCQAVS